MNSFFSWISHLKNSSGFWLSCKIRYCKFHQSLTSISLNLIQFNGCLVFAVHFSPMFLEIFMHKIVLLNLCYLPADWCAITVGAIVGLIFLIYDIFVCRLSFMNYIACKSTYFIFFLWDTSLNDVDDHKYPQFSAACCF